MNHAESLNILKRVLQDTQTLVIVGGQFGDEGKGKFVSLLALPFDWIVRFSGGANAGHTFYVDGVELKTHLIPSGIGQPGKTNVIARGVFFSLSSFIDEFFKITNQLKSVGRKPSQILIDRLCPLFTPYHLLLEAYLEAIKGAEKIGTTGKAIAPLEALRKLRISPVVDDLFSQERLHRAMTELSRALEPIIKELLTMPQGQDFKQPSLSEVCGQYLKEANLLRLLGQDKRVQIIDTSLALLEAYRQGKTILCEGAQAIGLDPYWGTYPFVSAGNSVAAGASLGTGLPPQTCSTSILVFKTVPTRVGAGPFVSEYWERQAAEEFALATPHLFEQGKARSRFLREKLERINNGLASKAEFSQYFQVLGFDRGATTKRGRSTGCLDLQWLRYAIRINGPRWLAFGGLDKYSGLKQIPVVTGYSLDGRVLGPREMPLTRELYRVEPVVTYLPGWNEDIIGARSEEELPTNACVFITWLEQALEVPLLLIGTGPEHDHLIVRT